MIVYPAIDIKDGKCVRLYQGKMDDVTVFSEDPVEMARKWQEAGAQFFHIVDLDGAVEGKPQNLNVVRRIIEATGVPSQLGGGIRDLESIEEVLNVGIKRIILGTVAVKNPALLAKAVEQYGETIVVGIDARKGRVSIGGWKEDTAFEAVKIAEKVEQVGVKRIIYTDIERDGTLIGPNIISLRKVLEAVKIPVIASGGVSVVKDVRDLKELEFLGLEGVIIGRALYAGTISLEEAISISEG